MTAAPPSNATRRRSPAPETDTGDDAGGALDAGDRGSLTISEKAIEKIAGQVAAETPGIHGSSGGFLGIGSHADEDARPRVSAQLHGRTASLQVRAGVRYPTPLRSTTERLRERISSRLDELCGIDVRQVDIEITSLVTDTDDSGRRELL
ncbi:hypothetical protein AC792_04235 [Arthrobacter sp. RIT-PI-e]|uniref:Asp23/Gls24 family envelope stress response protein n=1 Tax=Arthrobacter sp. RIT-PI-e TaxID=1681197 RepID=UPI000675E5A8|nr:Asp23/Gls24 family envelope stress response protein [Arthrobacter sp. RIT-PI-e]KNC19848.1 hypothetical protein AC792_04235 [Arthrobacter sp. RIT-PI-e]